MKKLAYTLSFVAFLAVAGKAQTHEPAKQQEPKKATEKPASMTPVPAGEEPKSRMAITQKGVPASKAKETKETKETKDAKTSEPKGQPTATEKH